MRDTHGGQPPTRQQDAVAYLPEPIYFDTGSGFPRARAARVTARYVARWATRYRAWPVVDYSAMREGSLPRGTGAREALLSDLFDEIEHSLVARSVSPLAIGLLLFRRDRTVLDQHDGIPGELSLSVLQFAELQEHWERQELPRDLYFAAEEQRVVTEPIERYGGRVLGQRFYSPLEWARRDAEAIASLALPSEAERRKALMVACLEFARALARRRAELQEPGRSPEPEELQAVEALAEQVARMASAINRRRAREGDDSAPERGPK